MVENAYCQCNPPEKVDVVRRELPPLFRYIRRLLCTELNKKNCESTLRVLRKLNWTDPQVGYSPSTLSMLMPVLGFHVFAENVHKNLAGAIHECELDG